MLGGSKLIRKPDNNKAELINKFKPIYTTMDEADAREGNLCPHRAFSETVCNGKEWIMGAKKELQLSSWADRTEQEEETKHVQQPTEYRIGPDANGIIEIHTFAKSADGKRTFETIRRVKQTIIRERVSQAVLARKQWAKFGTCKDQIKGQVEPGTTIQTHEEIVICTKPKNVEEVKKKQQVAASNAKFIPLHLRANTLKNKPLDMEALKEEKEEEGPGPVRKPGAIFTSERRSKQHLEQVVYPMRLDDLPEDTRRNDVFQLCLPFGKITKVFLADNPDGSCKGFAFVDFANETSRANAIRRLHGHGYGNMILRAEINDRKKPGF